MVKSLKRSTVRDYDDFGWVSFQSGPSVVVILKVMQSDMIAYTSNAALELIGLDVELHGKVCFLVMDLACSILY